MSKDQAIDATPASAATSDIISASRRVSLASSGGLGNALAKEAGFTSGLALLRAPRAPSPSLTPDTGLLRKVEVLERTVKQLMGVCKTQDQALKTAEEARKALTATAEAQSKELKFVVESQAALKAESTREIESLKTKQREQEELQQAFAKAADEAAILKAKEAQEALEAKARDDQARTQSQEELKAALRIERSKEIGEVSAKLSAEYQSSATLVNSLGTVIREETKRLVQEAVEPVQESVRSTSELITKYQSEVDKHHRETQHTIAEEGVRLEKLAVALHVATMREVNPVTIEVATQFGHLRPDSAASAGLTLELDTLQKTLAIAEKVGAQAAADEVRDFIEFTNMSSPIISSDDRNDDATPKDSASFLDITEIANSDIEDGGDSLEALLNSSLSNNEYAAIESVELGGNHASDSQQ